MVALGPVFKITHMTSVAKYLAPIAKEIELVMELFGIHDFLPNSPVSTLLELLECMSSIV